MYFKVIASGDFKQLPPVPNHLYGDDGSYCFTSQIFQKTLPHHINLKEVSNASQSLKLYRVYIQFAVSPTLCPMLLAVTMTCNTHA